jgi:hypothetical protein
MTDPTTPQGGQDASLVEARRIITGVIRRWPSGAEETSELRRALALLAGGPEEPATCYPVVREID